ncbi:30S ribosomal protein S8 [Candidatus Vidania fulgoroideorum]
MAYYNLSNFINIINNSFASNKQVFLFNISNYIKNILIKLKQANLIKNFYLKDKKFLCIINLDSRYKKIKMISKSSIKHYYNKNKIIVNKNCFITTNKGIMSLKEAKKNNLGGEIIFALFNV